MEQINYLVLRDPNIYPDPEVLKNILKDTYPVYEHILQLYEKYGFLLEWRYYNDGKAWLGKVTFKKKTVIWMSAWTGFIKATIYFPEKYTEGIHNLELNPDLLDFIKSTNNVGRSKPCMFELKSMDIIPDFETLIKYKLTCK